MGDGNYSVRPIQTSVMNWAATLGGEMACRGAEPHLSGKARRLAGAPRSSAGPSEQLTSSPMVTGKAV